MIALRAACAGLAALAAALPAAAVSAGPARAADSAVVLMYHRFGETGIPSTNIRLEQFEAHLAELSSGPYAVLPLPAIVAALAEGRPLPDRAVAVTVDDAFASVHAEAWPRLRAAGLPFTVFVATDAVDGRHAGIMTWQQIRELRDAGVTVGHHSAGHLHMPDSSAGANAADLERASARFLAELGEVPALFAYPYGEASSAAVAVVREAGFAAAFGQHSGAMDRSADVFYLPRFALNETHGEPARFRLIANALALPAADIVPADPTLGANPPPFAFTVGPAAGSLERLACYASGQGAVAVDVQGRRVETRIAAPFPPGRARVNCTLPGPGGRWHWLGTQFYVPAP